MSKKTTLERVYLHINNGGLTFSVVERLDVRKDCIIWPADWHTRKMTPDEREVQVANLEREDRYSRRWAFKIETYHFGATTSYSFPIIPLTVKWMITALKRVLVRMEAPQERTSDNEYPFEDQKNVHVTAQDGQQVDTYWPVPREPREASGSVG